MSAKINDGLTKGQRYQRRNKEKLADKRRARYAENRTEILAAAKVNEAKKAREAEYRAANKDRLNARISAWAKANPDKGRERTARYRAANPDADRESYLRAKQRDHGAINARLAVKRARKRNATLPYANHFLIAEAYRLAKLREEVTGGRWEVDHIVPLTSPKVCGLHVEWNLRVITRRMNRSKGNKLEMAHG